MWSDCSCLLVYTIEVHRIFFIKIVFNFTAQSSTEANISLLQQVVKCMDLTLYICIRKDGVIGLNYTGIVVYEYIMSFLTEHED